MRFRKLALLSACAAALLSCGGDDAPASAQKFSQALAIPPVLAPTSTSGGVVQYDLTPSASSTAFFPGRPATATYGYNGMSFLGPTIRLTRGQATRITLHNGLPADGPMPLMKTTMHGRPMPPMAMTGMEMVANGTSLHLHGLEVPDTADITPSGCCSSLAPGGAATSAVFTPDQPGATLWYHPHPHMDTGRQVYWGLGGLMILDDPAEASLALPHSYGVDDLPLIVQDRRFKADGSFDFRTLDADDDGVLGDHILVNGVESPYREVSATRIRLRLLNASNRRSYLFALSDGRAFQQIATDGGLLPSPASVTEVMVPPAGRAEVVVDFSGDSGKTLYLVSRKFTLPGGGDGDASSGIRAYTDGTPFTVLQFRVGAPAASAPLPATLATLPALDTSQVSVTRSFGIEDGGDNTINGKLFDPDRVDESVHAGAWEIWTVTDYTPNIAHPFHVHGIQFRVLDRTTGPLTPNDQGWKDTVRVFPGETVRLLLHFDRQQGRYMYHCHILEHEDMGMMGNYEVIP